MLYFLNTFLSGDNFTARNILLHQAANSILVCMVDLLKGITFYKQVAKAKTDHLIMLKFLLCLSSKILLAKYDNASAAIAQRKGSHDVADATLPKTIEFGAKNNEPIKNQNAPTKSG